MSVNALIVNPTGTFADEFATDCPKVFGEASACTWYDRPFDDSHPPMRPEPEHSFQLVVMDLEGWASPYGPAELVCAELPQWTQEVMRLADEQICVVILCPDDALVAVSLLVEALGLDPHPLVLARNFPTLLNKRITDVIFATWETWRVRRGRPPGQGRGPTSPGSGTGPGGGASSPRGKGGSRSGGAPPNRGGFLAEVIEMCSRSLS